MAEIVKSSPMNEEIELTQGLVIEKENLEKAPNEKIAIAHHHDSEYDTASDLEGGEEGYDENEESALDEDKDYNESELSSSGSRSDYEDENEERQRGDGQEQLDVTKNVDEDRSNPQYIPKKGTFYEHDDRTTEDPEVVEISKVISDVGGEVPSKAPASTVSSASKTMKKWQAASAVDRWSHDRYNENEQAPKSRSELVSAYGYDIRTEDGPPRARRRRRYGRGPSKYNRKWEDENAYIKTSNRRKPLRSEDFPVLNELKSRNGKKYREEKENHVAGKGVGTDNRSRKAEYVKDDTNKVDGKSLKPITKNTNSFNKKVEDKILPNNNKMENINFENNRHLEIADHRNPKLSPNINNYQHISGQIQVETRQQVQPVQSNNLNKIQGVDRSNNSLNEKLNAYSNTKSIGSGPTGSNQYFTKEPKDMKGHLANQMQNSSNNLQHVNIKKQGGNQLQSRLQQVHNRNDPSHVGSVQMHSIVTQQQQQPHNHNNSSNTMNQNVYAPDSGLQSDIGRSKRYSNLRQRNQTEQNIMHQMLPPQPPLQNNNTHQPIDKHNLQQMHEHVAAAAVAHQQQQALLQANLIQLYQDNLQTQVAVPGMQNINQGKPAASNNIPASPFNPLVHNTKFPQTAAGSASAYFGPAPNEFSVGSSNVTKPTATQQPYSVPFNAQNQPTPNVQQTTQPPGPQPVTSLTTNPNTSFTSFPPPNTTAQFSSSVPPPTQHFNTVGGTTYFVPHPQQTQRQISLPQRRPTNPIPILPPSDKNKINSVQLSSNGNNSEKDSAPTIDSVESIDHILDNMFVQRQPFQPAIQQSSSQSSIVSNASTTTSTNSSQTNNDKKIVNKLDDAIKNLTIGESDEGSKDSNTNDLNNSDVKIDVLETKSPEVKDA